MPSYSDEPAHASMEMFLAQNHANQESLLRSIRNHVVCLSIMDRGDRLARRYVKSSLSSLLDALETARLMRDWAIDHPEEAELFTV